MNKLRYWIHEWQQRRKIRQILAYHRKHPERTMNMGEMFDKEGLAHLRNLPTSNSPTISASGSLTLVDIDALLEEMFRDDHAR